MTLPSEAPFFSWPSSGIHVHNYFNRIIFWYVHRKKRQPLVQSRSVGSNVKWHSHQLHRCRVWGRTAEAVRLGVPLSDPSWPCVVLQRVRSGTQLAGAGRSSDGAILRPECFEKPVCPIPWWSDKRHVREDPPRLWCLQIQTSESAGCIGVRLCLCGDPWLQSRGRLSLREPECHSQSRSLTPEFKIMCILATYVLKGNVYVWSSFILVSYMKSQVLHTVWCNIFWWDCRGKSILITLGSERASTVASAAMLCIRKSCLKLLGRSPHKLMWSLVSVPFTTLQCHYLRWLALKPMWLEAGVAWSRNWIWRSVAQL